MDQWIKQWIIVPKSHTINWETEMFVMTHYSLESSNPSILMICSATNINFVYTAMEPVMKDTPISIIITNAYTSCSSEVPLERAVGRL
jgi:hypothetical protein